MNIGADGSHLRWTRVGFGRYLDGLLHSIERDLRDADRMTVFYNSWGGGKLFGSRVTERNVRMPGSLLWNQVGVPAALTRDRCDVYLGGGQLVPVLTRTPRVVVVHDCKAFRMPEADSPRWSRYWRRWLRASVANAAEVVAISHWTAAECEHFLEIPASEITVIHQGISSMFRPATADERGRDAASLARIGVGGRYVLQVGNYDAHKGGWVLEAAMREVRLSHADVALVRCGQRASASRNDAVIDLGYVSDEELIALYRSAQALCIPSFHEGFGLPALEAMACGAPVVASEAGALPEAAGDAALFAPPGDAIGFAAQLDRVLSDAAERSGRIEAGFARAAMFRWDDAARAMMTVLERAATRRR